MATSPDNHGFDLRLLGGFEARIRGRPVAGMAYKKMKALLTYLALEGEREHEREALAELLWSGSDAATARINLRRTLSELRHALEPAVGAAMFSAGRHTLRFIPLGYVDVLDFTGGLPAPPDGPDAALAHDERIAALYRGELLTGFSLPDCPAFEDWLRQRRETLHVRALALLERLSGVHEKNGDEIKALHFSVRQAELEPLDDGTQRRVMRLYAASGQGGAALRHYESYRQLLESALGVAPGEETRRLAERIRMGAFGRETAAAAARKPEAAAPAERRQGTVVFCELLAGGSEDPDEAMTLMARPRARCEDIVRRFSGHIVPTHGGGLLAYFGYPQAREHAPRHAVQAALAIASVAAPGIEIRSGVHTGLMIAAGTASTPDATGSISRRAMLLCQGAAPGEVAISAQARHLVEGYFDFAPGPVPDTFRVMCETGARSRLDAAERLTPLVGRQAELAKLAMLWAAAAQGSRQLVLIEGEAGIGKSRLLHSLKEILGGVPCICELRCSAEFSQSPFHPLIALIEAIAGIAHGDTAEVRLGKLARCLERHHAARAQDATPLLARLLTLPVPGQGPAPRAWKERTIAVLLDLLASSAARNPVLMIVEDLHWVDPSTLELIARFVERTEEQAVLALFTARPEFDPPWQASHETALALPPLSDDEVSNMIASLGVGMSAATRRRILERADGIPLFVEELARIAAVDDGSGIPDALRDILAVRLDRLGEAKPLAQLAATIGREFDLGLLRKTSPMPADALARGLKRLIDDGLILRHGDSACQFKHALIQAAAYESQTRSDRAAAHRRVARALQDDFPDFAATRPEILARHLAHGGQAEQAIEYWIKAGQRAVRNSAHLEAIGHFRAGLQLLGAMPEHRDRDRIEFGLLVGLWTVLYATKGIGAEETTQVCARISALSERVDDSREAFGVQWTLAMHTNVTAGPRAAAGHASRLLAMAGDDSSRRQQALRTLASTSFWQGQFASARAYAEEAIALYRPEQRQSQIEQFGETSAVTCTVLLCGALYFLGLPDRARRTCDGLLAQAQMLAFPHTECLALCSAAQLYRWLAMPAQAQSLSERCIEMSRRHNFPVWLAAAQTTHGWSLAMQGRREGLAEIEAGAALLKATTPGLPIVSESVLIAAHAHLGMHAQALGLIDAAQANAGNTGDHHFSAELDRLKAVCLLELSPDNEQSAEACFDDALVLSRAQGARSLELRAVTSMVRLWRRQGRRAQARAMLEPVLSGFTEGFDTADLREAAVLLRGLAKPRSV